MSDVETARELFFRGLDFFDRGDLLQAESCFCDAERLVPTSQPVLANLAIVLLRLRKFKEASDVIGRTLAAAPDDHELLAIAISCHLHLHNYAAALTACDKWLASDGKAAEIHNQRGVALQGLRRFDEALACYDRALALEPRNADAFCNRGNCLNGIERFSEAEDSFRQAIAIQSDHAGAWTGLGNALFRLKREQDALEAYRKAIGCDPDSSAARLGFANALSKLERHADAIREYDRLLERDARDANAWLGRGNAKLEIKQIDEAQASFAHAVELVPDMGEAWLGIGNVASDRERFDEAYVAYDKAFRINPRFDLLLGARLNAKLRLCDWNRFAEDSADLVSAVGHGECATNPFLLLGIPSSRADQQRSAKIYTAETCPTRRSVASPAQVHRHDRIRIAYLSADFRQHPTSELAVEMFEKLDRAHFEVWGIYFGPPTRDAMHARVKAAFDKFIDVGNLPIADAITHVKALGIDVAVDLMGHTLFARTALLAARVAPVQVSYLGYPGTMGAEYIDYVIADPVVIPDEHRCHYSEKVVRLPDCYQVNSTRSPASSQSVRADNGLPPRGFVYCCFNNSWKINPSVFDSWMRILSQTPDSVLWLLETSTPAVTNLRKEAQARHIDSDRLVFAPRIAPPEHLARHCHADLFLDTWPYNAHTTASDALWMGLPVLTRMGETFPARVGASLLTAIDLPELIADTHEAYEARAVEFALRPDLLAGIKSKLVAHRSTTPLFDTSRFVRNFERACIAMHDRYRAGLSLTHMDVARLD
jgi:protein O-GlcNAc transferase